MNYFFCFKKGGIPTVFLLFSFALTACAQEFTIAPQTQTVIYKQAYQTDFKIPENLTFAGEAVPTEDDDIRERLEREIIVSANRHAAMIYLLKKENRWKKSVLDTLQKYNIPTDFFYLAVAESDLDVYAQSPKKALGYWQFMEETAIQYKLAVNDNLDERRDPLRATAAAAKFFIDAYKKFGNWTSVAASYNRGMNGLQRAMENQKQASYYDLYLNPETSRYVFRILSLKIIMENPEQFGFCLADADKFPAYDYTTEEIKESIEDLPQFAKDKGISFKMLKLLNPALEVNDYNLIIPKGKSYILRMPVKK
jgi:hypothetical protein